MFMSLSPIGFSWGRGSSPHRPYDRYPTTILPGEVLWTSKKSDTEGPKYLWYLRGHDSRFLRSSPVGRSPPTRYRFKVRNSRVLFQH